MGVARFFGMRSKVKNTPVANTQVKVKEFVTETPVVLTLRKGEVVQFMYDGKQRVGSVQSFDPDHQNLLIDDFDAQHPKAYKVTKVEKMSLLTFN